MKQINGLGVSPGIAIGHAFVVKKSLPGISGNLLTSEAEIAAAIAGFTGAINGAISEIEAVKTDAGSSLTNEELAILEVHIELLSDPEIFESVTEKIRSCGKTTNDALLEVIDALVLVFENMDDEYMQARAADMTDIGNRILNQLNNPGAKTAKFDRDTIVIADDIAPSDTMTMDIKHIRGFATRAGGKTSHAAIIAKAKGLPAIAGCGGALMNIETGDTIIVDGSNGVVYINPDEKTMEKLSIERTAYNLQTEKLKALKNLPAVTTDGKTVILSANISGSADMEAAHDNGAAGFGLLRTELLFMNRQSFPTGDEQFEFYKQAALLSKNKPVVIRTIDIGGDKQLPYFNIPAELNPFLGYRAIRICLDRTDLFITQLKAILRAAIFGELRIMFPMIGNMQEIRAAKKILEEAKAQLLSAGIAFKADIKVGIMIEIPSAAVTADLLAKEVDFFSIGTNDLCQYTLAVDRMNEKITHLYDPYNPGVLRLIANVIEQGRRHNIHVAVCGEMAADPPAALLLLGMGLDEFSMSPAAIPVIKNIIRNNSKKKAGEIYTNVMQMDTSDEIITYLKQAIL